MPLYEYECEAAAITSRRFRSFRIRRSRHARTAASAVHKLVSSPAIHSKAPAGTSLTTPRKTQDTKDTKDTTGGEPDTKESERRVEGKLGEKDSKDSKDDEHQRNARRENLRHVVVHHDDHPTSAAKDSSKGT